MLRYQFTISHTPGKELVIVDMLPRAPTSTSSSTDQLLHQEASAFVNTMIQGLPATEGQLEAIKQQQEEDAV